MTLTQIPSRLTVPRSQEERDHLWRNAVKGRIADLDMCPTHNFEGKSSLKTLDLGDLLITDWSCPDFVGTRNSKMVASDPETLLLFAVTSGQKVVRTPTETAVLRPGQMLLMSSRATGEIVVPECLAERTVRVPLAALAQHDTGPGVSDILRLEMDKHPLARLTHEYLASVDGRRGQMSATDVEGAREALLVLIAGMIRSSCAPDMSESAFLPILRRALEDWIADHLRDGPIRVADVAAAHNVAPRTVHRAFASTGDTMGAIVRAHRLAGARNELVHSSASIAAIANRWGFCDASHLGREFRREFSMSPGDYRAAHGIV